MKKYIVFSAGLCLAMLMTGCKSSESAYKQAYLKAQQQANAQQQEQTVVAPVQQVTETPVVTPVVTRPANQTQVVDNVDNVSVRQERVSLVNGSGLKNFSVVVGSMTVAANAESLQQRLNAAGYNAQIAKADVQGKTWYRVIAATFDSKADAVTSRDQLRSTYPDAWLLFNIQ